MTPSQTIGPFFHFGLPGNAKAAPDAPGERIRLRVHLLDGDGVPVPDGLIELWQPDARGFGRLPTDANGACEFETARTAFANVIVFSRGLNHHLYTRAYFDDAVGDEVMAQVPEERRGTLRALETAPGEWDFEIRLQGEGETVFFDFECR